MTSSRNKPGVAFWATATFTVALLYPISFGPACWTAARVPIGRPIVKIAYGPLAAIWAHGPMAIQPSFWWYANLGLPNGQVIGPILTMYGPDVDEIMYF